ncbi:MAG: glycosyltransferase family 4 protein [Anditalea sp.]
MRIIYIHQYFVTPEEGGAIRSYHLAKGLVEAGLEVEMITAHNHSNYDLRIIDGIKVHYLPVPYDNAFGFLKRTVAFSRFVTKAKSLIKRLPRPDLLYITSTPLTTGLIGLWAKKKFALPYIFEVRDLWPEAPIQVGVIRNKLIKKALYYLEERIYSRALKIVALSPGIKNYIRNKCQRAELFLIPNFCDTDFFSPVKKDGQKLEKLGLKERFTITYTGAVGSVNALHEFIYLAKDAQDQSKDWQFILMGKGMKKQELEVLSKDLRLKNLKFHPFGNKREVREILAATDIVYVSFDHFPVLGTNSPNKFFDALAMGKAVLVNHKGWVYELIKRHRLGLYHNPGNHRETIRQLAVLSENPQALKQAQKNSRSLATLHFSKEKAVRKLLFVLDPVKFKMDTTDGVYILTA